MIKTNELRIGNFVSINDKQKAWEIMDGFDIDEMTSNSSVDAISLTEEWLVKFGFEKMPTNEYWFGIIAKGKILHISLSGNVEIMGLNFNSISLGDICKYVHQLQNLYFSITGEELVFSSK